MGINSLAYESETSKKKIKSSFANVQFLFTFILRGSVKFHVSKNIREITSYTKNYNFE